MKTQRKGEVTHCARCPCEEACKRKIEALESIARSLGKMNK